MTIRSWFESRVYLLRNGSAGSIEGSYDIKGGFQSNNKDNKYFFTPGAPYPPGAGRVLGEGISRSNVMNHAGLPVHCARGH